MDEYDVIVIGGGPGGLTAGIMSAYRGLKVLVLEGGSFGGLMTSLFPEKLINNYPGFPEGIISKDLALRWIGQAEEYGVEMRKERVIEITPKKVVKTNDGEYQGRAVVIATGNRPRELGVKGEAELNIQDKGVYYYVTNKERFKDKRVLIVGGGDSALDAALDLLPYAFEITLVHRRDEFRGHKARVEELKKALNVNFLMNTQLKEIKGIDQVEGAVLLDNQTGEETDLAVDRVILSVGLVPNNEIFKNLGLELDSEGRIAADVAQRTDIKGVYAVGDIVSGVGHLELIIVAVAQGAVAAHNIYVELFEPYWA